MLSNRHTVIYLLMLGIVLSVLQSCGFRLRGDIELPAILSEIHISGIAEYSELNQELRKILQRTGSRIIATPDKARSIVNIRAEGFHKRVLSVDAQGRAAEYELIYKFKFTVVSEKREVVPEQEIELIRDYRFDPNNVLAKDTEEAQIRKEMIRFSVRQMMRRIESHLKHS